MTCSFEVLSQPDGRTFLLINDFALGSAYAPASVRLLIKLPPAFPETAALLFGELLHGADGEDVLVVRHVEPVPDEAYVERRVDRIRIDPVALNRLVRRVRDRRWSIVTVHSHPGTTSPWFSWADDAGDARLMPSFAVQVPGVPHGSMVLAGNGTATLRSFGSGGSEPSRLVVVGRTLTTWPASETNLACETTSGSAWRSATKGKRSSGSCGSGWSVSAARARWLLLNSLTLA